MDAVFKELSSASFAGRLDAVQTLLKGGVSPHGRDSSGLTALHRAAIGGHAEVALALIGAGADVNERDAHGDTALHYAAFCGSEPTVRALLSAGASTSALGADGRSALASAADAGHAIIVNVLVAAAAAQAAAAAAQAAAPPPVVAAPPSAPAPVAAAAAGASAAAASGGAGAVALGGASGALPTSAPLAQSADATAAPPTAAAASAPQSPQSPYERAVAMHAAAAAALAANAGGTGVAVGGASSAANAPGASGGAGSGVGGAATVGEASSAAAAAVAAAAAAAAAAAVSAAYPHTSAGLCDAAFAGDILGVHTILSAGVDPNAPATAAAASPAREGGGSGDAATGEAPGVSASSSSSSSSSSGSPSSLSGGAPLHRAAAGGSLHVVELLLARGARVDVVDGAGCTPLHFAAFCGHVDVVHMLVNKGCDAAARNRDGKTALEVAQAEKRVAVVKLLSNTFLRVGSLSFSHGVAIEGALRTRRSSSSFGSSVWRWKNKYAVVSRVHKALFLWTGTAGAVEGHVTRLALDNVAGVTCDAGAKNFTVVVKRGPALELATASVEDSASWVTVLRSVLIALADDAGKNALVQQLLAEAASGVPSSRPVVAVTSPPVSPAEEAERLARRIQRRLRYEEGKLAARVRCALVLQRTFRGHTARRRVRGWAKVIDPTDGDVYWFNVMTGQSSWYPPGEAPAEGNAGADGADTADAMLAAGVDPTSVASA